MAQRTIDSILRSLHANRCLSIHCRMKNVKGTSTRSEFQFFIERIHVLDLSVQRPRRPCFAQKLSTRRHFERMMSFVCSHVNSRQQPNADIVIQNGGKKDR